MQEEDFRIDHLVFIEGYDYKADNDYVFNPMKKKFQGFANRMRYKFLSVKTNIVDDFIGDMVAGRAQPAILTSVHQILGKRFRRILISSSFDFARSIDYWTNPIVDSLYSTDTLDVIHIGADKTRVEKTLEVSRWPLSYDILRVCKKRTKEFQNCCRCEKCIRTMLTLKMLSSLGKYNTFPRSITQGLVRRQVFSTIDPIWHAMDNRNLAKNLGHTGLLIDLSDIIMKGRILNFTKKSFTKLKMRNKFYRKWNNRTRRLISRFELLKK